VGAGAVTSGCPAAGRAVPGGCPAAGRGARGCRDGERVGRLGGAWRRGGGRSTALAPGSASDRAVTGRRGPSCTGPPRRRAGRSPRVRAAQGRGGLCTRQ